MDVIVFRIEKVTEKALLPELADVHVLLGERIVLEEVVDLPALLDGFDKGHALGGSEEGGHLAHHVLARVQRLDAIARMGREPGGDKNGVEILCKEFILVVRDESIGAVLVELRPHELVVIAARDDIDIQRLAGRDKRRTAPESPDTEANPLVRVENPFSDFFRSHLKPIL